MWGYNLGHLSLLSVKLQTIKLSMILCFHIKFLFHLFTLFCIKIIVPLIHELGNIFNCLNINCLMPGPKNN
jgi:hypothetical protein